MEAFKMTVLFDESLSHVRDIILGFKRWTAGILDDYLGSLCPSRDQIFKRSLFHVEKVHG